MRPGRPLLIVALATAVTACGSGEGTVASTTTTTTGSGSSSTVAITIAPTLSDLTGTWGNGAIILEVNDGGEYLLIEAGGTEPEMGGFVARDGDRFSFVTATTGSCPGQTGTYEASVQGDTLTLTVIDDPCGVRATWFASPLTRGG